MQDLTPTALGHRERYDGGIMMMRTQISFDAEEHKRAKARAASLGISFAEYVRRLVSRDLGKEQPKGDISVIFGLGHSGGSDIARFKDEYIGEAVEAEYEKDTGTRPSVTE
jgi:hypothetical protein